MTSAERFLQLFRSRQSACAFGLPNPQKDKAKADGSIKAGMDYRTEQRPFNLQDVEKHFAGKQSIVAIPLLNDGNCYWGALDIDVACEKPEGGQFLNWFPSKSKGWHGFVFFETPQPADRVRYYLSEMAEIIGHKGCEVFPKQVMSGSGNGINLPFFGEVFDLEPKFRTGELPEPPLQEAFEGSDDDGYWTDEALKAMLMHYSETIDGFEWLPFRNKFSVPCPGYELGWEDGSKHSANQFPRISHETLVWVNSRGWPKFRCVHAHCDTVKTFNMWRAFWDPFHSWEWDTWIEDQMKLKGDYVGF